MSIQTTGFPLVLDADDFQRTDWGIRWGIKCHRINGFGDAVYVTWWDKAGKQYQETLDDGFDIHVYNYGGDVTKWLKEYLLPRLNSWLAKTFTKTTTAPAPAPAPTDPLEAARVAIGSIVITVNADGTLKASL